jgi:hypothetical protein
MKKLLARFQSFGLKRRDAEPITQAGSRGISPQPLCWQLKVDLAWLREQVLAATRRGDERGAIHQANLIPPGLLNDQADVYQPYLILREHVIDRLYDAVPQQPTKKPTNA